jgi:hypothetical protein
MNSGIEEGNKEEMKAIGTVGKKKMRVIKYRMKERD